MDPETHPTRTRAELKMPEGTPLIGMRSFIMAEFLRDGSGKIFLLIIMTFLCCVATAIAFLLLIGWMTF